MIGYLKGKIVTTLKDEVILDVSGVGYRVRTSRSTQNVERSTELELFVHTAVREDAITLYGFPDVATLQLFELLITVSGIGPKTAMHVIALGSADQIEEAIRKSDINFLTKASGLGKKGAQRLMVDLKSKIGSYKEVDLSDTAVTDPVVEALMGFGFKQGLAEEAMKQIDRTLPEGEQIKLGLKMLGKKGR